MDPEKGIETMLSLPSWAGTTFVPRHHDEVPFQVPKSLDPTTQSLPSPFVAAITGASRGIGAGIAKALAQAGATGLILTARSAASIEGTKKTCESVAKNKNLKIIALSADNGAESSAVALAETIRTEFSGHIDLLVNNAGILNVDASAFGKVADISVANIEAPNQTNFLGRFYMIKHILPLMLADSESKKSIINISSIGSQLSGPLGYSLTALATNRLSQRVTESYADQGVFCVAMHPGAVLHDPPPLGAPTRLQAMSTDSVDLAGAWITWLVKEKREYLNGRYVDVTWDVGELEKKKDEIVKGDKLKMRLQV